MSQTRATVRIRIQEILGDMNPSDRVFSIPRMNEIIARNYQTFVDRTIQHTSSAASISVTASTYDYTIDASNEVKQVHGVFDVTNNRELFFLPFEEFNSIYLPDATTAQTGQPIHYTLYEGTSQLTKIRLGPIPNVSLTLHIYRSTQQSALTSEGSSLALSDGLCRGLEAACAADLLAITAPERLALLAVSKDAIGPLRQQAEMAIREHNARLARLGRRQDRIIRRPNRWAWVN